jgi:uncharacterized repeat protein (TIGR03803 family)
MSLPDWLIYQEEAESMPRVKHLIYSLLLAGAMTVPPAGATTLTTLYNFQGGGDGGFPATGVVYVNGALYGVTPFGGTSSSERGVVFKVDPATGTETVIHNFACGTDGCDPEAGLTYHLDALFGTTAQGGNTECGDSSGCGTIFKVNIATGVEKVLYRFKMNDGGEPNGPMIYVNGVLYGTLCGASCENDGYGAVFQYDLKARKASILYRFKGGLDGQDPRNIALLYNAGTLYGTTSVGGDPRCSVFETVGCGTVFSVNSATGQETILHRFKGGSDGIAPMAGLTFFNNKLFGTTAMGGHSPCMGGCGTAFNVDPVLKSETVIHTFEREGGFGPKNNLVLDQGKDRSVHRGARGPTENGGNGYGSIFNIDLGTGKVAIDYVFQDGADGGVPSGLTEANGVYFGTTYEGGGGSYGTVFALTP